MKTIITTLPVYDRIEKTCYKKGLKNGWVQPPCVKSPRFRLPSMQWNAESDNPGEVVGLRLYNEPENILTDWTNGPATPFSTFASDGPNITSAIATGASLCTGNTFFAHSFEIIDIEIVFTLNAGTGVTLRFFNTSQSTVSMAASGAYHYVLHGYNLNTYMRFEAGAGVNFSAQCVIRRYDHFEMIHNCMESYIVWTNNSYDTFTTSGLKISSLIKSVAAGAEYAALTNVYSVSIGDKLRLVMAVNNLTGTAPKVVLVDSGGLDKSNIVTLKSGMNIVILTSTVTDANARIRIRNLDTETVSCNITHTFLCNYETYFEQIALTNEYFQYNGDATKYLLPTGQYQLKITTANGYIYWSELFEITCIFPNLISAFANSGYETLTISGTTITSAINSAGSGTAYGYGDNFNVIKGETIKIIFYLTLNSGDVPNILFINVGWSLSDSQLANAGLNEIELTSSWSGASYIVFQNTTNTDFSTSEILVIRQYSEKYLIIDFENSCDLGDILYHEDFEQTLFLETEPMEQSYPTEEEGQKNSDGKFIRTFSRQVKKYTARTLALPDYMIDVFNRLRFHDIIELTDLTGNVNDVHNLEVEHTWVDPGKYYAIASLTFDYDEVAIGFACCENIS